MVVDQVRPTNRFALGDQVEVAETCKFYGDWARVVMTVIGIDMNAKNEIFYTTAEGKSNLSFNPFAPSHDGWSDVTDSWREEDLVLSTRS